jgi:hypothetical protein
MEGGKLVFQIKTLEAGGLPMSALQYSLAPAKPVMLASGKVIRSDLWNKRHDYLPSANFMMKAV